MVAMVPATNEPMALLASAGPARPARAMRLPSHAVAIEPDSPGGLSRMAVAEPPNIAPQTMPANLTSAPVGSSFTVSGSSSATVSARPTPGSTPTKVPSVTPMKPHIRFIGCSATPKPAISAFRASMSDARAAEDRREPASGQVDVQQLDEKKIDRERKDEADRHVAHPSSASEAARDAGEDRKSVGKGQRTSR